MILKSYLFKRVTIVGVGLMGGSLGLSIRKNGLAKEVTGLSQKQESLSEALRNKAIDIAQMDIDKAIRPADLVILATPVDSIIKLLPRINPYLKRSCIVTDIGSAKVAIVEAAEKILSVPGNFVGSHPLTGSEKKGVRNASAELFENGQCVMTPTNKTKRASKEKVKLLWNQIGMKVKKLSGQEHDEALAYISHLPHLLAYGLMETIPQKYIEYASQGLKDTSRIASSSPQMWNDICLANSKNLLNSLDHFVEKLAYLRKAIINNDDKSLIHHFTKAKEKRDAIKAPQ